jgi:type IV pilus assembly protein PilA
MRNAKGFTLVELLVVILIITILATILIPNFTAFRKRAYDAVAVSYLNDAAKFQEIHLIDYNSYTGDLNRLVVYYGLKPIPTGLEFRVRSASDSDYCMVAGHPRGTYYFAATPSRGVYKTTVQVTNPPPSSCP